MPDQDRCDAGPASEAPCPVREAVLKSGGIETRYRRAGTGSPVLLLAESPFPSASIDRLFEGLARTFRVIRPEIPESRPDPNVAGQTSSVDSTWIRELIDGLGLRSCALVADGRLFLRTTGMAFSDTSRVSHLALLIDDFPNSEFPIAPIPDLAAGPGCSVLLIRSEPDLERLVAFLQTPPLAD